MSLDSAASALRQYFKAEMDTRLPGVPILWPNVFSQPPASGGWMRFEMLENDNTLITLADDGNREFQIEGLLVIDLFVPLNTGDGLIRRMGDAVIGALSGKYVSPVQLQESRFLPVSQEGNWEMAKVLTDFTTEILG